MTDITITHIRLSVGTGHEHIVLYQWVNGAGTVGARDRPTMVDWIDNQNVKAFVTTAVNRVAVGIVRPKIGAPYLRTHADREWTNNLLSLPHF